MTTNAVVSPPSDDKSIDNQYMKRDKTTRKLYRNNENKDKQIKGKRKKRREEKNEISNTTAYGWRMEN